MDTKMLHTCKRHSQACYLLFDSLYAEAYLADKGGYEFKPSKEQLKALKGTLTLLNELAESSKTIIDLNVEELEVELDDAELPL